MGRRGASNLKIKEKKSHCRIKAKQGTARNGAGRKRKSKKEETALRKKRRKEGKSKHQTKGLIHCE